jgi:hypothetical protein
MLPTDRSAGGVSLVQTVGSSSDEKCLPAGASSTSSFFTLNPTMPPQCSSQTISWNSTRYYEPPDLRGFVPGGWAFGINRPTSNSTTQLTWDVQIQEGTRMVLLVQPAASNQTSLGGSDARTSPLITITGKGSQGDMCLVASPPSSTLDPTVTAFITTLPEATKPVGK